MRVININVNNELEIDSIYDTYTKASETISKLQIPTGNVNEYLLNFNFTSPNPSDLVIIATFDKTNLNQIIQSKLKQIDDYEYACYVPWEVLCKTGDVSLGLYGFVLDDDDGSLVQKFSLEEITFEVTQGTYSKTVVAKQTPSSDVIESYIAEVKSILINQYQEYIQNFNNATCNFTDNDRIKLNGIEDNANNYVLPIATEDILGGIIVGDNLNVDESGRLNAEGKEYSVATTEEDGLMSASDKAKLDEFETYDDTDLTDRVTNLEIVLDGLEELLSEV